MSHAPAAGTTAKQPSHGELRALLWIAEYCYDAADREGDNLVLPLGGIVTAEVETRIEASIPVQREVAWHDTFLAALKQSIPSAPMLELLSDRFAGEPLLRGQRIEDDSVIGGPA